MGLVGSASTSNDQKMVMEDMKYFENCIDGLKIAGKATAIHKDEMIDGEERPDLDGLAIISAAKK